MYPTKQITKTQLETLRRVMVKRIAKDLTAEKLSFLMGRPQNYVTNIESLITDPYNMDDLKSIAIALDEKNYKGFFAKIADQTLVNVMVEAESSGNQCVHTYSIITEEYKKQLYFTLQEDLPSAVRSSENNEYDSMIATDAVKLLIRVGYFFKSRLPVNVYQSVNRFLKVTISPTYVQNALNSFCDGENEGALKRSEKAGKGIFYIEA